jgi:hypothetical protein
MVSLKLMSKTKGGVSQAWEGVSHAWAVISQARVVISQAWVGVSHADEQVLVSRLILLQGCCVQKGWEWWEKFYQGMHKVC